MDHFALESIIFFLELLFLNSLVKRSKGPVRKIKLLKSETYLPDILFLYGPGRSERSGEENQHGFA